MKRNQVLETLRQSEQELRARGVRRVAIFGSVARGDDTASSDLDIFVEIDPDTHMTVFDYAEIKDFIAGLFDGRVDVVNRDGLKQHVRPAVVTEAVYAF